MLILRVLNILAILRAIESNSGSYRLQHAYIGHEVNSYFCYVGNSWSRSDMREQWVRDMMLVRGDGSKQTLFRLNLYVSERFLKT